MLRALLRFVGLVCLAGGFATLVVDGTRSIAGSSLSFTRFGDTLAWVAPKNYEAIEPAVEKFHPLLWNSVLARMFDIPTWTVLGLLGLGLIFLGRPRAQRIGFSSRP